MIDNPRWSFIPWREGDIHSNPFSDEFFAAETIAASLVREPVQNSLDARAGHDPVLVRYTFSASIHLPTAHESKWFRGLWPHLISKDAGLRNPPSEHAQVPFLLVEDFGTLGLGGDPFQLRNIVRPDVRNDFFYFWRNLGRSGKSDMERGRWGLGKSVFSAASKIQTIFGLTVRASDQRCLLYGQSVLGTHDTEAGHFTSYGFFGQIRDDGSPNELALPIDEAVTAEEFSRAFSLTRSGEPGLSVVVPHPAGDVLPSEIVREAILHFYYPILSGDLVIEVVDDAGVTRLTRESLRDIAQGLKFDRRSSVTPGSLSALFDMAEVTQATSEHDLITLAAAQHRSPPRWREENFPEPVSSEARDRFNRGEIVGFRVPLSLHQVSADSRPTFFDAFFQRDPALTRGDYQFLRQGIRVTNVKTTLHRGVRAMLVARDPVICSFLGDAEDPTHTQWEERNRHFQDKYEDGVLLLRFVKQSLAHIGDYLLQAQAGMDPNLLSNIFFVDLDYVDARGTKTGTGGPGGPIPPPPPASQNNFVLSRCEGGFRVGRNRSRNDAPRALNIEVAYEVARGDAFRKYSPLDFDVAMLPIEVLTSGVSIISQRANRLSVQVTNPEFAVLLQGFDPQRDIRVRVTESVPNDDSQI
ncbi:MAG: hypothetical protein H0U23_16690 [Blastocatellia bacterium]|nr:hypothetical protein [Blastocatellia bacterium]